MKFMVLEPNIIFCRKYFHGNLGAFTPELRYNSVFWIMINSSHKFPSNIESNILLPPTIKLELLLKYIILRKYYHGIVGAITPELRYNSVFWIRINSSHKFPSNSESNILLPPSMKIEPMSKFWYKW